MTHLFRVDASGGVDEAPIAAEKLVEGAPVARTVLDYERDGTFVGEWSAGVGAWRVSYDEWEFCHVIEGACELVPEIGAAQSYKAGDSFVIEPGFKGVWRVLAPMRKRFVVRV